MTKRLAPLNAIRRMCRECAGGPKAADDCPSSICPLFHYRHGTNPFRVKRIMSEEQKAQLARNLLGGVGAHD